MQAVKQIRNVIASTRSTENEDAKTIQELEAIVRDLNTSYVCIHTGHDPRVLPKGRIIAAELHKNAYSDYEAIATIEIFSAGQELPLPALRNRELKLSRYTQDWPTVIYEASVQTPSILKVLEKFRKKCALPMEAVVIKQQSYRTRKVNVALCWGMESLAAGLWPGQQVKPLVRGIMEVLKKSIRSRPRDEELVMSFEFTWSDPTGGACQLVFGNPLSSTVDWLYRTGFKDFQILVQQAQRRYPEIVRFVGEGFGNPERLVLLYGIRWDGVPVAFTARAEGKDGHAK